MARFFVPSVAETGKVIATKSPKGTLVFGLEVVRDWATRTLSEGEVLVTRTAALQMTNQTQRGRNLPETFGLVEGLVIPASVVKRFGYAVMADGDAMKAKLDRSKARRSEAFSLARKYRQLESKFGL